MKRIAIAACLAGLLAGCASSDRDASKADIVSLQSQVSGLANKLGEIERGDQPDATTKRIQTLEADVWVIKTVSAMEHKAVLDPISSEGYMTVDVGLAKLAVTVADIQPYADGTRIVLTIGNPTSAVFNGLEAHVIYGSSNKSVLAKEKPDEWQSSLKTRDLSLVETISPGRWTRITLTLPSVKPDQLGHLELELKSNQIALHQTP